MKVKRFINNQIAQNISNEKIIMLVGARQTGKTTILNQIKKNLDLEGLGNTFITLKDPSNKALLNQHPDKLFEIITNSSTSSKKQYILIDEIQYLDDPTNFLKYHYDLNRNNIKLIVTGSSAFYIDKKFKDSLVGRKVLFEISTLSFEEFLLFKEKTDLCQLLKNTPTQTIGTIHKKSLDILFNEYTTYGGYPEVVLAEQEQKKMVLSDIVFSYIKKDILEAGLTQDEIYYSLMKILAAQVGSLVNKNTLAKTLGVSTTLIHNYLYVMQKSFHIHLLKPFHNNINKEIRKMPKVYFQDIGIRNFLLNNFEILSKRTDNGQVFENIIFRQLYDKSKEKNTSLRFWRTKDGNEVDFIYNQTQAYEVKYNDKKFSPSKYKRFKTMYPHIPIKVVGMNNYLELI